MARKSKTNKNVVIVALIVMLLLLAVGYAAFSDTLTISGTANAKGTFDLQFENAEIVKAVGVTMPDSTAEGLATDDAEGTNVTSAKISADGNTLNVNVADLAYPGAGVEFSVDIVNKGSISAKVNDLVPNGLEGNDIIKIEGLDQITLDHPTIKAGEKCNIHFTVFWPENSTEVLPEDGISVEFGLQIEYIQSSENETFYGKMAHTSTNSDGTITVHPQRLVDIVKGNDYGKEINYSVVVNGVTIDKWRIFSNDGTNVKIITTDFLPQTAIPQAALDAGLEKVDLEGRTTYCVYSNSQTGSRDKLLTGLTTGWEEYAKGVEGAIATGTPTYKEFVESWNTNAETKSRQLEIEKKYSNTNENSIVDTTTKVDECGLYIPHAETYDGCPAYWFASPSNEDDNSVWLIGYDGNITNNPFSLRHRRNSSSSYSTI